MPSTVIAAAGPPASCSSTRVGSCRAAPGASRAGRQLGDLSAEFVPCSHGPMQDPAIYADTGHLLAAASRSRQAGGCHLPWPGRPARSPAPPPRGRSAAAG